jgi:hypothetical protein
MSEEIERIIYRTEHPFGNCQFLTGGIGGIFSVDSQTVKVHGLSPLAFDTLQLVKIGNDLPVEFGMIKAFSASDKSGNGILDIDHLGGAIGMIWVTGEFNLIEESKLFQFFSKLFSKINLLVTGTLNSVGNSLYNCTDNHADNASNKFRHITFSFWKGNIHLFGKISNSVFDKSATRAILSNIGCGNLKPKAETAAVIGGDFLKKSNTDSLYNFESAGRALLHGVTLHTISTPAGSFFVPDVEIGGKSQDLMQRRLKCKTILHTVTDNSNSLPVQSSAVLPHPSKKQSDSIRWAQSLLLLNVSAKKKHCSTMLTACRYLLMSSRKSLVFSCLNTPAPANLSTTYL